MPIRFIKYLINLNPNDIFSKANLRNPNKNKEFNFLSQLKILHFEKIIQLNTSYLQTENSN